MILLTFPIVHFSDLRLLRNFHGVEEGRAMVVVTVTGSYSVIRPDHHIMLYERKYLATY